MQLLHAFQISENLDKLPLRNCQNMGASLGGGTLFVTISLSHLIMLLSYHHTDAFSFSTQPQHSCALPPSIPFVIALSAFHVYL